MEKVILDIGTLDALRWPERCPRCGIVLSWESTSRDLPVKKQIAIEKGFWLLLPWGTPKKWGITFCKACSEKISSGSCFGILGCLAATIAILGLFFIRDMPPEVAQGGVGWLLLSGFFYWIEERIQQRRTGVRIVRLSRNKWAFYFRNPGFAEDFAKGNLEWVRYFRSTHPVLQDSRY